MEFPLKIMLALAVGTVLLASCRSASDRAPSPAPTTPNPDDTLAQPFGTFMSPNVQFEVAAETGTCPETVSLWEFGLGFEGGADHTVVADFAPLATAPAEILQSEDRRIVYAAPLKAGFADCTGTATSQYLSMYAFQFGDGTVQFKLDLRGDDGFRDIRYADISANRPYIHWRAAE
ncbi:hypothetical protein IQ273_08150 [Nodosilinea sp. LEGE 07298]|uniref:hypothetical protein n=1 Tax=Nodosilinea sp. LEGE 07298 TaxID=2777970 RepID=UPI00187F1362|nr:hypothetical protein [Nodosilinea sp. LEGE 07298]MBE9109387.1 hypothetical protein [Nodosilinea sp. LEGE 07298]